MAAAADDVEELNKGFLNFMLSSEDVEKATEEIYEDLVDEVLMGFVFDVHRSLKWGIAEAEEGIDDGTACSIVDGPGLDVFGEPLERQTAKCNCPKCDQLVWANRFATHLEKCLGMGRNSARAASRRLSNTPKPPVNCSSDETDDDWSQNKKRKRNGNNKPTEEAKPQ